MCHANNCFKYRNNKAPCAAAAIPTGEEGDGNLKGAMVAASIVSPTDGEEDIS
jgi:hypothetical protein